MDPRSGEICNHSHFQGKTSFNGAHVEGNALFNEATFLACANNPNSDDVDFIGFTTQGGIECVNATFCGQTTFNGIRIGRNAFFSGAALQVAATFRGRELTGQYQGRPLAISAQYARAASHSFT